MYRARRSLEITAILSAMAGNLAVISEGLVRTSAQGLFELIYNIVYRRLNDRWLGYPWDDPVSLETCTQEVTQRVKVVAG